MNQYSSVTRRYVSKGIYSAAITPPNDFSIAAGGFASTVVPIDLKTVNPQTNFRVNSVGIFSNFADGLVWKNPGEKIICEVIARGLAYKTPNDYATVSATVLQNSKDITLSAVVAGMTGLEILAFEDFDLSGSPDVTHTQVFQAASLDGGTGVLTVRDYPFASYTAAVGSIKELDMIDPAVNFVRKACCEINTLYDMVPLDLFISPSELWPQSSSLLKYVVLAFVFHNGQGTNFLTKSINTAFAASTCFFDFAVDVEYTLA